MKNPAENDILWEYMDRLRWRLRKLPEQRAAEMLREIRQHMQDLVADYVVAGATPEEAVRKAEGKFGSAEKVGDRLMWERGWLPLSYIVAIFILVMCCYQLGVHGGASFSSGRVLFAAIIGVGYGLLSAFCPPEQFRRQRSKRSTQTEALVIAIIIAGFVAMIMQGPRRDTERLLTEMAAAAAAGVPTFFVGKALRKRARGARL